MRQFARRFIEVLDSKPPRGARGQSLLELALTAPILFLMVIGIVEVGFLANNYMISLDALREGGRFGVLLNPMNWHTSYTDPAGDEQTRNQQRADCETKTSGFVGGANWHVNKYDRDVQLGYAGGDAPHPNKAGYVNLSETDTLGFYDAVMCQVVAALDPLPFNYDYDDIAISVIAFANRCNEWAVSGPAGCYEDPLNYRRPIGTRHVTVTGRFPLSNRKCTDDTRDPFAVPGMASNPIPVPGAADTLYRGYIVTGNMVNSAGCIGSWFYLDDSKTTYSTPEPYNIDYILNSLPDTLLQANAPGGALVLVELYWRHTQLFNFPPFNLFNDASGGIRLHIWQAFPMVAAEPTPTD